MAASVPSSLAQWAARHAITPAVLADLLATMGVGEQAAPPVVAGPTKEGYVQSIVRLEAPKHGVLLTRNNVGALQDETGRVVRFGLFNESKDQNDILKSPDLVGIRKIVITDSMVGTVVGQFVAREVKHAGWTWGEDLKRETAQLACLNLITSYGGDARFVTGLGSFNQ